MSDTSNTQENSVSDTSATDATVNEGQVVETAAGTIQAPNEREQRRGALQGGAPVVQHAVHAARAVALALPGGEVGVLDRQRRQPGGPTVAGCAAGLVIQRA